jgi:hypothetical protein
VDGAIAAAIPHLRDTAGRQMTQPGTAPMSAPREPGERMSKNLKTALILASVVIVFFAGIVLRHWIWPSS